MEKIYTSRYRSPLGEMIIGSCADAICICDWTNNKRRAAIDRRIRSRLRAEFGPGTSEVIQNAIAQLNEYFAGRRTRFAIPLRFTGSDFQCRVWSELGNIAYGETISYAELARRIGNPNAVRAVAAANAANPISILVPCHRVIGSNRRLTGYAGGLRAKQGLLDLEASAPKW